MNLYSSYVFHISYLHTFDSHNVAAFFRQVNHITLNYLKVSWPERQNQQLSYIDLNTQRQHQQLSYPDQNAVFRMWTGHAMDIKHLCREWWLTTHQTVITVTDRKKRNLVMLSTRQPWPDRYSEIPFIKDNFQEDSEQLKWTHSFHEQVEEVQNNNNKKSRENLGIGGWSKIAKIVKKKLICWISRMPL